MTAVGGQADVRRQAVDPELLHGIDALALLLTQIADGSLGLAGDDLTPQQHRALEVFAEQGPIGLSALTASLGIHQSSGSRLCDRLVQKGLLNRTTSLTSRRELAMSLTPEGRARLDGVRAARHDAYIAVLDRMPAGADREVLALLAALRAATES